MAFDYSSLLNSEHSALATWRDIYDEKLSVADNLLSLLQKFILLPYDHYDIIAAYLLLPSALCRVVPYLFLFGQSGTAKSTCSKLASYFGGVPINTSSDTYAGIRNGLKERKYQVLEIPHPTDPEKPGLWKKIEDNTVLIWDDIDPSVLITKPDLYRLFKVGYDRSTDKISMSSETKGENLTFRCFCPKIFSSISPIHLHNSFKELRRRLIVIPFARVEELPDTRLAELGLTRDNWKKHLLNIDSYQWNGFSSKFKNFWNRELAEVFLLNRQTLSQAHLDLSSQEKVISVDLLATGITSGIWQDEDEGVSRLKEYFDWYQSETSQYGGLSSYLKEYISSEASNAKKFGNTFKISSPELLSQIQVWLKQGWLLEKPKPKEIKETMADLGLVLQQGYWVKRK
ncbi:MAG: hypothetical protein AB4206_15760 [Xenococcaceae cyanobacterium]